MREKEEDEEEVEAEEEQPSGRMSLCRLRDKKAGDDLNMEERGAERQRDTGREGGRRRRREGGAETVAICRFTFCTVVNIKGRRG